VDEVHPENSVMYEDAFGRPLMQPLHGLPECMPQINACFLVFSGASQTLPRYIDDWIPRDKEKYEGGESSSCLFHEWMY
jgi:hypothetical protein